MSSWPSNRLRWGFVAAAMWIMGVTQDQPPWLVALSFAPIGAMVLWILLGARSLDIRSPRRHSTR